MPGSQSNKRRSSESSSRRVSPSPHPGPLLDLKPSAQLPPVRHVEVTTTNINDLFNQSSTAPPPPLNNLIVPESSRRHQQSAYQSQHSPPPPPHVPVKVHVAHKPTVEDITRVYNPYPLQVFKLKPSFFHLLNKLIYKFEF